MKKTIKINFMGMPKIFPYENMLFYKILEERYHIQIAEQPDYMFCSVFDNYSFCRFEGIRIFFPFECFYPDMNVLDYALEFTEYQCGDRCCRMYPPIELKYIRELQKKRSFDKSILKNKTSFCNYIYSHRGMPERKQLFDKICEYKKVDSAGKYLNNMDGFTPGSRDSVNASVSNNAKIEFQKKYKFTIACENYSYPFYNTEKLTDAFFSETIPIYYGDPEVGKIYNEKAFINAHNYQSFDEVLNVVREIDHNDEMFLAMLNEPIYKDEDFIDKEINKIRDFLYHIFDQEYQNAFRRPNVLWPKIHEERLLQISKIRNNPIISNTFIKKVYKTISGKAKEEK